jgi:hypothetical protein
MEGTRLADKNGADSAGVSDSAGAVNWENGVSGAENPPMGVAGNETRICAKDGDANDTAAAMTAKRRSVFTMAQV